MKLKTLTLALLLCLTTGCIHKAGTTGTTPQITPWERVSTDNALLAQANNTLERGAEAVASSKVLTPAQVEPVIALTGQVATLHQQITAILQKGALVSGGSDAAALQSLIAQIQTAGTALVNSGALGVKNPATQQTFSQDIQLLVSLTQAIISDAQVVESGVGATQ